MVFGSALTEDKNYTIEGTCKIFLYRTLMANLRNRGQIVTTTASSDIAATLLPGGQTTHSRFNLQLDTLLQHVFFFSFLILIFGDSDLVTTLLFTLNYLIY
jgi:hypothetical protein